MISSFSLRKQELPGLSIAGENISGSPWKQSRRWASQGCRSQHHQIYPQQRSGYAFENPLPRSGCKIFSNEELREGWRWRSTHKQRWSSILINKIEDNGLKVNHRELAYTSSQILEMDKCILMRYLSDYVMTFPTQLVTFAVTLRRLRCRHCRLERYLELTPGYNHLLRLLTTRPQAEHRCNGLTLGQESLLVLKNCSKCRPNSENATVTSQPQWPRSQWCRHQMNSTRNVQDSKCVRSSFLSSKWVAPNRLQGLLLLTLKIEAAGRSPLVLSRSTLICPARQTSTGGIMQF